jgi:hypothetical protein
MKIGIYTPYDFGETTAAAIRLAEVAQYLSYPVTMLTPRKHELTVNPFWDRRVRVARHGRLGHTRIMDWTFDSHVCVWFGCYVKAFQVAMGMKHGTVHVLVPGCGSLMPEQIAMARAFHHVVCPSLQGAISVGLHTQNAQFIRWTSGIKSIDKEKARVDGRISVAVTPDADLMRRRGYELMHVLEQLLQLNGISFTVVLSDRPSKRDHERLEFMRKRHPGRFQVRVCLSTLHLKLLINDHDWLLVPSLSSRFGLPAQYALACHVPVVAWDVDPFDEMIEDGHNGYLIPCENRTTFLAREAVWDTNNILDFCASTFYGEEQLTSLISQRWREEEHEETFRASWDDILPQEL